MKITPIKGDIETEGAPYVYRGNKFIVARSNNNNFKKVFREVMKPYNDELDNNRIDEDKSRELMIECVAKSIVVDWETITDSEGKQWEYSVENAISLLTDDKDCYDAISRFSDNVENYLSKNEDLLEEK